MSYYNDNDYCDYLAHHGIKGMHWGIRRYQNPDGTLTEEGRRRISAAKTDRRQQKLLKKAIQSKRAIEKGGSNRWARSEPIGSYSKAVIEETDNKRKQYLESKEYKAWAKKYDNFEKESTRKIESGEMSIEDYDRQQKKIWDSRPKKPFDDPRENASVLTSKGWKYMNDYANKGGYSLSIAYLKDLGYSADEAERLVKKMAKKGLTAADF